MSTLPAPTDLASRLAHHLHAIARALAAPQRPQAAAAFSKPDTAVPVVPPPPAGEETFLSLDGTVDLGNGSRMFIGPRMDRDGWAVLHGVLAGDGEPSTFDLKGILPGTLDAAAFVAGAYRLLLDREPDLEGLGDYLPVLEAADGRAEVLRLLASSGEASALPRHLIIAPESMLAGDL